MKTRSSTSSRRWPARLALAAAACALIPGCFTFTHTIGRGPNAAPVVAEESQWFALWGIVPVSAVDSAKLAGPARDYRVTTKFTVIDVVISAFTSFFSFYRQTVIVEK